MIETKSLKSVAEDFIKTLKRAFYADDKIASGKLINSLKDEIKYDGKYFSIELDSVKYFEYVNDGRRAGKFPPINDIKNWIRVKGILPTPDINGKIPTENQLAYLIGRKIALSGIRGTKTLERTERLYRLEDKVIEGLFEEFDKVVDKEIDKIYD